MRGYSRAQIALHWLIAILIVASWITHEDMGRALRARLVEGADATPLHVPIGVIVFVLVLIRLALRFWQGAPEPVGGSPLMRLAAIWGHRLLYALMLLAPALGIAAWFGGIREAGELHEAVSNALMLVALAHAALAIWHQYWLRDGGLTRMLRPGS